MLLSWRAMAVAALIAMFFSPTQAGTLLAPIGAQASFHCAGLGPKL